MSSAPQNGAAGAPQPRHMAPCACHCAACRAAGHGGGACVVLCAGLHALFDGKADVVDLVLRHYYYGACGWDTARFDAAINCVQYGPGVGDVIAAGADDGRIHFICAQTGEKILCPLTGHTDRVTGVCFDPTGKTVVSCSWDKTIRFWDSATGAAIGSPVRGEKQIKSVAFSPDGSLIAAGDGGFGDEGTIRLYNAATGDPFGSPLTGHQNFVTSVHFSPDGKRLVSGSLDETVMVWDPSTGEQLCQLRGEKPINSVAFSPDGSLIAAGDGGFGDEGTIRLYNAATGDPFGSPLRGHSNFVTHVAFKPDNPNILVSGSWDKTIKTWDITSGSCLSTLEGA